jgi:quercetin dioxygenase-like cupin family protein
LLSVVKLVVGVGDGQQLPGEFEIRIKVRGQDTGGVMAVIEETIQPHALIPPHVHDNDVWVFVLSGRIGVLVGDEVAVADAGSWALKPRSVMHAMWNAEEEPARLIEVLTPAGSECWFEEISALADDDHAGFLTACEKYGISFLSDSPWISELQSRFGLIRDSS